MNNLFQKIKGANAYPPLAGLLEEEPELLLPDEELLLPDEEGE